MTPVVRPRKLVDLAHPFGVAPGEVVVDGDDVDALACERVEIDRERRDQRLAFAGLHLGDVALMQHHAADQLDVEMALAERAFGRLAHGGEGRNQEVVQRLAVGELLAEFGGARLQRLVRQRGEFRLERVDGVDAGLISLDPPVIGGAEKLAGERADHAKFLFLAVRQSCRDDGPPGCLSTHRDASRQTAPIREHPPNEWEFSNPRFNGQKRKRKYAPSPLTRFGRDMAGPQPCQRREAVKDFIILTDFSRCQGRTIGRVSRRPKQPLL